MRGKGECFCISKIHLLWSFRLILLWRKYRIRGTQFVLAQAPNIPESGTDIHQSLETGYRHFETATIRNVTYKYSGSLNSTSALLLAHATRVANTSYPKYVVGNIIFGTSIPKYLIHSLKASLYD